MFSTRSLWLACLIACNAELVASFSVTHLTNKLVRGFAVPRAQKTKRMAATLEHFGPSNNTMVGNSMNHFEFDTELKDPVSIKMEEMILADALPFPEAQVSEEIMKEVGIRPVLGANGTDMSGPLMVDEIPKILPASEVVGEPVLSQGIEAPSISKIVKFAIPAMGVWLCNPLLSMIDTSAVGMLSGTINQAALNPAVAVTDYAALCIAFLYTATTNMVASARESEQTAAGRPNTTKFFLGAMQLSTFVGAGLGAVLFVFARQLLTAITGTDAVDPAVFASAMKYVRIRSLGMPAAAIIGSAQAACLGLQDIASPLYVLLAAAIVNFVGDMTFVGCSHPIIGGAAGAAWATVFSQYAAVALFMRWLRLKPKPKVPFVTNSEHTGGSTEGPSKWKKLRTTFKQRLRLRSVHPRSKAKSPSVEQPEGNEERFSVKGLLAGRATAIDLVKLPPKEVADKFVPYVVPVTTTQIGRVSGYLAMSHVVSTALGTVSMASQQILLSIFYCLCPLTDCLNLSAQSFVPAIWGKKVSKARARALDKTMTRLLTVGVVLGIMTTGIVGLIPFLSRFFTSDAAVMATVNTCVPYLAMYFLINGLMCASEGSLLGQKDLGFLGKMYSSWCIAVPYLLLRLKRASLSGAKTVTLASIWKVFLGYQFVRVATWVSRIIKLQMKANKEARASEEVFLEGIAIQDV